MAVEGLANIFLPIIENVKVIVGGIFGLYVVLLGVRIYYERQKVSLLKDIRYDLDYLNKHYGLNYSGARPRWWKRYLRNLKSRVFIDSEYKPIKTSKKNKKTNKSRGKKKTKKR